jgi:hypothetical protein
MVNGPGVPGAGGELFVSLSTVFIGTKMKGTLSGEDQTAAAK